MKPDVLRSTLLGFSTALILNSAVLAQNAPPPPVTVAKPVVRDVVDNDEFIGRFQAREEVSVRSRVGGYLQEIHFSDGALVKQGDLLFVIDQRPFLTALNQAKATLEIANTALTYAQAQFSRTESLSQTGSQSASTLDDRRRDLLSSQANVRGSQAALERAQLDLDYSKITAPLSGRIDRHLISTGNLVEADQTVLTTIVALDPIDFYFDVDERRMLNYAATARSRGSDLQQGGGGLDVTVRIGDAAGTTFKGKLDFAENRVDSESGTMRVRASFANPDFVLQPGLFGRVDISGSNTYRAVLVPDESIGSDQNERVVFVVGQDGTVSTKSVRLGPRLYGYRVIRSGLTGDETIIVNGILRARPGGKVTPTMTDLPKERTNAPPESAAAEDTGAAQ
ncbi:efflux RND transporter periplasmic adaptor subunit [Neorhizobium sp. P12A]|jgi:RND family efflux transporter MFP subunit|uniref:efflux RND transporter periplasmic adaptor subunit n=1 Tax=Rhizobium/Agrobacterium group TaxID=227290 RepID=UPI001049AB6A|nr:MULTISPECIES: efflux RND transporter periplasmic adaptor subunit [Rhizobium/Agrobacterium group]KAA0698800.1 efflux RND transporter periplasmic adaptor subunit [Neorhizobium sp. P12A]TCR90109.1 RND family efflux transporter MFP subunit [Rhizobium sp. BK376]